MGAVAVFGATGGVGRHAVLQLLGAGQEVIAVVRDPSRGTPLANAGARVVTHDLQHDDPRRFGTSPQGRRERGVRGRCGLRSAARPTESGRSWGRRRRRGRGPRSRCRPVCAGFSHRADRGPPPGFDDAWWTSYYAAKHAADEALRTSGLRWTVIRPGALSDAAPTGHVSLSESLPLREIPRADVASLGIAILGDAASVGHTWDATSWPLAIRDAVRSALVPCRAPNQRGYRRHPTNRLQVPGCSRRRCAVNG